MSESSRQGTTDFPDASLYRLPPGTRQLAPVEAGPDGRCIGGCLSEEHAYQRANPDLAFDLADSAASTCYSCRQSVCVACGEAPAPLNGWICELCGEAAAWQDPCP